MYPHFELESDTKIFSAWLFVQRYDWDIILQPVTACDFSVTKSKKSERKTATFPGKVQTATCLFLNWYVKYKSLSLSYTRNDAYSVNVLKIVVSQEGN